jgi:hypothetical protein
LDISFITFTLEENLVLQRNKCMDIIKQARYALMFKF